MKTARVTQKDIAGACGYTVNTVSRALRGDKRLSQATRERIQAVADEMGYMGNQIASSLRSGRTRTLAVILGNMSNPFYGIMADTIQDAATARRYSLLIMCSRERPELERELVEAAVARRVDGILLFPSNDSLQTIQWLKSTGVPFVLMFRALGDGIADSVICDETRGANLATGHLIEHGCHRLGYLSHQRIAYSYQKRLEGFDSACAAAGIDRPDRYYYIHTDSPRVTGTGDWYAALTENLLAWRAAGVDGLFVFCDEEAWHVQYLLSQSPGLQGWDVGIVSFDNIQGTQYFPTNLCSVDCGFSEMARQGIELLRARIHGDEQPPRTVVCPVRLVCRGSCGASRA